MLGLATIATVLAIAAPGTPVNEGACPGDSQAQACYLPVTDEIYVQSDRARSPWFRWFLIEHERGHAMDRKRLSPWERYAFSCLSAVRSPYQGDPERCGADWNFELYEIFADVYANCRLGAIPGRQRFGSGNGYEPTRSAHARACRFIARAVAS